MSPSMQMRGMGEPVLKMREGRPLATSWDCKSCRADSSFPRNAHVVGVAIIYAEV
jgi:hypothetical protein